jgi:SAM-dependent methyltransferase
MQERYLVGRAERFAAMVELVAATQARVERLLDLGCGPGSLSLALLDAFPHAVVYGVDFDPSVLLLARARLACYGARVHLVRADLRQASWAGGLPTSLDAVVSATALHWLAPDELAALYRQLAGLLQPGGIFLNADHVGSEDGGVQLAWETQREVHRAAERRARAGQQEGKDWDDFWAAYGRAIGYTSQKAVDGWEGGVEEGLPLAWHLDQLRACGFRATDCFARWDCDALYGGIRGNEEEE